MSSKNITDRNNKNLVSLARFQPYLLLKHFEQNVQVNGLWATSEGRLDFRSEEEMITNAVVDVAAYAPFWRKFFRMTGN